MRTVFFDAALEAGFSQNGYAVVRGFLPASQCEALLDFNKKNFKSDARAFNITNWNADENYRLLIHNKVIETLLPRAQQLTDRFHPVLGVLSFKYPGAQSGLAMHQDWSLVDEKRHRSFSVWLALCDMDENNGTLQVAEGSHLYAGYPRGMNISYSFLHIQQELNAQLKSISLRQGDAIVFDHRLIHASPPNATEAVRTAAVMAMIPDEAEFIHYYLSQTKTDTFEILKMDEQKFYLTDFFDIPNKPRHLALLREEPAGLRQIGMDDVEHVLARRRFHYPFYKESALQDEVSKHGYAVRPLLSPAEVEQLKTHFFSLLDRLPEGLPDTHWTSGRLADPALRNMARKAIEEVLPHKLSRYFPPAATSFEGGIFLAKKPSSVSELTAHQDSSHTDEKKYPSVYAWVPLTDTNVRNGAMHVIPGSHLWGNRYRSLNVPWLFSGMEGVLTNYLVPVPVPAGHVLFFDSAIIHYSSHNLSEEIRPAVNYYIKPKDAAFTHYFIDEKTPAGKVEAYHVDVDFFYNCDFMQRPPQPYVFCGYETYDLKRPSAAEIESWYHKYLPASVRLAV